jgi:predicted amidophosphoribosyltransferase
MPLPVIPIAAYVPQPEERSKEAWAAFKFVRAVKGEGFTHYAWIPKGDGTHWKLEVGNSFLVYRWFAKLAAPRVRAAIGGSRGKCSIVPIPASALTAGVDGKGTAPYKLAAALAKELGSDTEVDDVLRWAREMPKAHSGGGTRRAKTLYQNLQGTGEANRRCILVDDVLSSGGHLRAAAAELRRANLVPELAVCAGRTFFECPEKCFELDDEELDDFVP